MPYLKICFLCCFYLNFLWADSNPINLSEFQLKPIIQSSFSEEKPRMRKGMLGKWKVGIGEWRIENGRLIGDELEENHHASSLTHHFEAKNLVIKAQIRLGTADKIAFACRDTVPPKLHLARLYISHNKLWVQHMSGIAKTTKSEKLITKKVSLDPNQWYDVTIQIIGNRYKAQIGEFILEAQHDRFADAKGIVALVNKGKGAEFKNVSLWHADLK